MTQNAYYTPANLTNPFQKEEISNNFNLLLKIQPNSFIYHSDKTEGGRFRILINDRYSESLISYEDAFNKLGLNPNCLKSLKFFNFSSQLKKFVKTCHNVRNKKQLPRYEIVENFSSVQEKYGSENSENFVQDIRKYFDSLLDSETQKRAYLEKRGWEIFKKERQQMLAEKRMKKMQAEKNKEDSVRWYAERGLPLPDYIQEEIDRDNMKTNPSDTELPSDCDSEVEDLPEKYITDSNYAPPKCFYEKMPFRADLVKINCHYQGKISTAAAVDKYEAMEQAALKMISEHFLMEYLEFIRNKSNFANEDNSGLVKIEDFCKRNKMSKKFTHDYSNEINPVKCTIKASFVERSVEKLATDTLINFQEISRNVEDNSIVGFPDNLIGPNGQPIGHARGLNQFNLGHLVTNTPGIGTFLANSPEINHVLNIQNHSGTTLNNQYKPALSQLHQPHKIWKDYKNELTKNRKIYKNEEVLQPESRVEELLAVVLKSRNRTHK